MDYLSAEALIKTRLAEKVGQVVEQDILSADDLEGVAESAQATPALHVMYGDDELLSGEGSNRGSGKAQNVNQLWLVIVVVRNVSDTTGESSRQDAGEIITAMLEALQGWQPSPEHSTLKRVKSNYKTTYRNGFAYFPFQFSTQITVIGTGNG